MTTKLKNLQLNLLSHAAKNSEGNVFPLPDTVSDRDRADKELKALLRRGLVTEHKTTNRSASWRQDSDIHFGLILTKEGMEVVGLGEAHPASAADSAPAGAPTEPAATLREARAGSKIANVLALLKRKDGATLAELTEATGWLSHTTRAALTGLKKKGHVIAKTKRGDTTCYHIGGGN